MLKWAASGGPTKSAKVPGRPYPYFPPVHKTRKIFFAPRILAAEPGQVKRFAALRRPLYAARSHKAAIWPAPEAFLAGPRPAPL